MTNNDSRIWARPNAIVALSGFSDRRVRSDMKKFQWPSKRKTGSQLKYYDLRAVEKSYGYKFTAEQIRVVGERLIRVAIFSE